MMGPLICERCGKEIKPGQNVQFVGCDYDELVAARVITDRQVVIHAKSEECVADFGLGKDAEA
jgi:hypothetical protein